MGKKCRKTCQYHIGHWSVTKPARSWQVTGQFSAEWEVLSFWHIFRKLDVGRFVGTFFVHIWQVAGVYTAWQKWFNDNGKYQQKYDGHYLKTIFLVKIIFPKHMSNLRKNAHLIWYRGLFYTFVNTSIILYCIWCFAYIYLKVLTSQHKVSIQGTWR